MAGLGKGLHSYLLYLIGQNLITCAYPKGLGAGECSLVSQEEEAVEQLASHYHKYKNPAPRRGQGKLSFEVECIPRLIPCITAELGHLIFSCTGIATYAIGSVSSQVFGLGLNYTIGFPKSPPCRLWYFAVYRIA